MKIYTRGGDSGETSLIGGVRLPKHHPRVEAYGTIDELIAWIGMLRSAPDRQIPHDELAAIQADLMSCSAIIATHQSARVPDNITIPGTDRLESAIDRMEGELPRLTSFILPGGEKAAATANLARTVCRRAERAVAYISETEKREPDISAYLNRLSDYLFVISRWIMHNADIEEVKWNPARPAK